MALVSVAMICFEGGLSVSRLEVLGVGGDEDGS
jgi:hypothetical protein